MAEMQLLAMGSQTGLHRKVKKKNQESVDR